MKKIFAWIAVLSMLLGLCACGKEEADTQLVNPVRESTAAEILSSLGITFTVPEGAEEVSYAVIDDGTYHIAQMQFTWQGESCCCRIAAAGIPEKELPDISGMFYDWTEETEAPVGYNEASLSWIDDEQGIIRWYDYAPGLLYSVTMDGGASRESLTQLAAACYQPVQGDVGGAEEETSPDLINLLSSISRNYHGGTAGCSLSAAKYAGMLLDWFAAEQPAQKEIEAATIDFLSTLGADALEEFSSQMQDVYAAAQELCGENGEGLLSDCGYDAQYAPWDAKAMEQDFTAILHMIGQ